MWHSSLQVWEFMARGFIVYLFLLVLLRFTGKRQVGQLSPFDLVLLLVLSNSLQNAINGGDNSVVGGAISATTLVAINYVIGYITYRSKHMEALIEGRPMILIHDGHINREAMRRSRMTKHELDAALRAEGHAGPECVRFAVLENNGKLTVLAKR